MTVSSSSVLRCGVISLKKCKFCRERLPLSEFAEKPYKKGSYAANCRPCVAVIKSFSRKNTSKVGTGDANAPYRRLAAAVILAAFDSVERSEDYIAARSSRYYTPFGKEKSEEFKHLERDRWFLQTDLGPFGSMLDMDAEEDYLFIQRIRRLGLEPVKYRFDDGVPEEIESKHQ